MKILISNDDGIEAPGLKALLECLPEGAEIAMVAPAKEMSAMSHSITLHDKIKVDVHSVKGIEKFSVHGTPADCIKFALYEMRAATPDLIIAGINQGANTGCSVYYSGTIAAAREGFINRIPSMAVSLCSREFSDFRASQAIVRHLIRAYEEGKFPLDVMLNVNVPALEERAVQGVKITKHANSRFVEEFIVEKEHDTHRIYSLAGEIENFDCDGTSDEEAVKEGYVSVTPMKLDVTHYDSMNLLRNWVHNHL